MTRCAACKYLRKVCPNNCIFAPYFPSNSPKRFEDVHRIYGAKNVATMLKDLEPLPPYFRAQAVETLCFEAQTRIQNPVHGCVGIIFNLLQQIHNIDSELAIVHAGIAVLSSNGQRQGASEIQFMRNDHVHGDHIGSSSTAPHWFCG